MNPYLLKSFAVGLMVSGAIKMFLEATRQDSLIIPTCFGQTISVQLPGNAWTAFHCWGCYAFIAGLILLTAYSLYSFTSHRAAV